LPIDRFEAQRAQVERIDESVDHSHGVVYVDVALQPIREQKSLGTINAIHESLHAEHPSTNAQILPVGAEFLHGLGGRRTRHTPDKHR
jgi:hypothetical protein